jgi:hypothetical protein
MTFPGHVRNGVVLLDNNSILPEGAEVRVELVHPVPETDRVDEGPTIYDSLAPFIGKAGGLPADMSVNLDHYLYGTPKRE